MPKQKSHSGAKKRFKITKNGQIKRGHSGKSHLLTKKSPKRKRALRTASYVDESRAKSIKKILPYA